MSTKQEAKPKIIKLQVEVEYRGQLATYSEANLTHDATQIIDDAFNRKAFRHWKVTALQNH
jgi:hypothetical protein